MLWKFGADLVSAVHTLWVFAVLFGPLWAWHRPWWRGVHLALLIATAAAWSFYCPLTVFENSLRFRFDPSTAYASGFLEHSLRSLLDFRRFGAALAWGVRGWAALWIVVYAILWTRETVAKTRRAGVSATSEEK